MTISPIVIALMAGWLLGAVNAIELVKEIADSREGRFKAAGLCAGLSIIAIATVVALEVGVGLTRLITWGFSL